MSSYVDATEPNVFQASYVNRLAMAVAEDFADYVADDERYAELIHDLAAQFIDERLPIIDEDAKFDVAFAIMDKVAIQKTPY